MLLNYLYSNFYESQTFITRAKLSLDALAVYQAQSLVPNASYSLQMQINVAAFTGKHQQAANHQFYCKNYIDWLNQIQINDIKHKKQAFDLFQTQYTQAQNSFIKGDFGAKILEFFPTSQWAHIAIMDTWQHFLNGTYGLCTKRGMPSDIFMKHVLGGYITHIMANYDLKKLPIAIEPTFIAAVNALDNVTASFAPHELANSSRARNINTPLQILNQKEIA